MTDAGPIIVLGASGFVGRQVVADLSEHWPGFIVAVTRRRVDVPINVHLIQVMHDSVATRSDEFPVGGVVVNLIFDRTASREGNLALASAIADLCGRIRAERLVHVSTADVVGRAAAGLVDETVTCRPVTPYQSTKLAVEERLRGQVGSDRSLIVVRPTAVFGSGGHNLRKLTRALIAGSTLGNYARACLFGRRAMHLVPVETVAAAVRLAAASERAVTDGLYFVGADDDPENNFSDVERILRAGLGLEPYSVPPIRLPEWTLETALRLSGRLSLDLGIRFDARRLAAAGFAAPVTLNAALQRYANEAREEIAHTGVPQA